ncbi:hypothetical protein [Salimicrobium flavidum]|uniref:Uncharacterized protein n=1 Tax=Salimicrobium flavidum TaxID=570947 RepID=A0A1N7JRS0_9BACI|nr:hypothetical protein [Salimicrobium flavidum]SIS52005.1 hypothetical protein SAMN05421687_107115 [Salimicrobium flavidum]
MKRNLIYGMGALTVVTWSVAIVLMLPKNEAEVSEEHSTIRSPVLLEENVDFAGVTDRINDLRSEDKARTVFGKQTITDEWEKDMDDNGRVSIDTLLSSLDSDDS